ncbi:hypothetical protein EKO23_09075 [Nocardioides guangzhouensis]|uniref:Alpha/beta hydrolase n=1 Tax=Nocardioides guangzhouensis TaxID=2497878 RepID=A0A4Q4ZEG0_9ACTN|nr:hypothetical protein [Nocardioides guangzhouensis]RYP86447.1 hypothetical protein EKO23_09075 [Nocardioides guangzhouensis]
MTSPALALLPSPLLGPRVWADVADRLRTAGADVVVARTAGTTPAEVLASALADLPEDRPLALVPHSNAGLYVPALAAERRVTACVFVDAALPEATGPTRTAPPGMRDQLATLAGDDDGLLPPWTEWWSDSDLAGLFPDPATRAEVVAEQPRLPLSYFDTVVPSPPWSHLRCAYLAFGTTYGAEAARAREAGWPVSTLPGRHLHMLVDPVGVAVEVVGLLP